MLGRYSIRCRGLYCGDCPLAIFITFAGRGMCVMTSSQSTAQDDRITMQFMPWFVPPGLHSVHVSKTVSYIALKMEMFFVHIFIDFSFM